MSKSKITKNLVAMASKMYTFEPVENKVLVRKVTAEEKEQKKGSIILPDTIGNDKQRFFEALVIAVGPKVKQVKPEDRVLVSVLGPVEIDIEFQKFFVAEEPEILTILHEAN